MEYKSSNLDIGSQIKKYYL